MRTLTIGAAMMQHPTLGEGESRPDSIEPRLAEADSLLAEASQRSCDICCLPELFADPSQGTEMATWAEELGGPATSWLARMAREYCMTIVATVALRNGDRIANTGLSYNREGNLTGTYAKVHLPDGEASVGTPGDDFPVWDVEGITVGIQICYDLGFPEGCRILAVKGARIIFWPNMWGGMPEANTEVIMRARAMENAVLLVSSAYFLGGAPFFRVPKIHGRSCIVDQSGTILAEVGQRLGLAVATVDIPPYPATTRPFADRLPHLYGALTETG